MIMPTHEEQLRKIAQEQNVKRLLSLTEKMWEEIALIKVEVERGLTPWLDKDQAAAYIGMSRSSMDRYMDRIPYSKATGRPKFNRQDLDAFMRSQYYQPAKGKQTQLVTRKRERIYGV